MPRRSLSPPAATRARTVKQLATLAGVDIPWSVAEMDARYQFRGTIAQHGNVTDLRGTYLRTVDLLTAAACAGILEMLETPGLIVDEEERARLLHRAVGAVGDRRDSLAVELAGKFAVPEASPSPQMLKTIHEARHG